MNEIVAREKNRERIKDIKNQYLNSAEWKVLEERRSDLNAYKSLLSNKGPNMPASIYESPPGTQYDISKISRSLGIRCLQLKTNEFNHKIPLDRTLMCLNLARPSDNPENIIFPYGFTEDDNFKITNVIMPIDTYEALSKEIYTNFETDMVYNQNT
jgi:hypothetical protein